MKRRENSSTRGVSVPTRPAELTVDVIVPKLAGMVRVLSPGFVETVSEEEGWPYWARLKRLNASARTIALLRSVMRKPFSIAESSCQSGGPVRRLRPALAHDPAAGNENAAGLIQCEMPRLPRYRRTPGTRLGLWFTLFPSGSSVLLRLRCHASRKTRASAQESIHGPSPASSSAAVPADRYLRPRPKGSS